VSGAPGAGNLHFRFDERSHRLLTPLSVGRAVPSPSLLLYRLRTMVDDSWPPSEPRPPGSSPWRPEAQCDLVSPEKPGSAYKCGEGPLVRAGRPRPASLPRGIMWLPRLGASGPKGHPEGVRSTIYAGLRPWEKSVAPADQSVWWGGLLARRAPRATKGDQDPASSFECFRR
jgi:hypothetical protein